MEHRIEVTHTRNEDPAVPDALHLRCGCGWTSSASDQDQARELVREHEQAGTVPAPPPSTPSPD